MSFPPQLSGFFGEKSDTLNVGKITKYDEGCFFREKNVFTFSKAFFAKMGWRKICLNHLAMFPISSELMESRMRTICTIMWWRAFVNHSTRLEWHPKQTCVRTHLTNESDVGYPVQLYLESPEAPHLLQKDFKLQQTREKIGHSLPDYQRRNLDMEVTNWNSQSNMFVHTLYTKYNYTFY